MLGEQILAVSVIRKSRRGHFSILRHLLLHASLERNGTLDDLQMAIALGRESIELYRGTPSEDSQSQEILENRFSRRLRDPKLSVLSLLMNLKKPSDFSNRL